MKLTRESLKQIIKEELEEMMGGGDQELLGAALNAFRSAFDKAEKQGMVDPMEKINFANSSLTDAQAQRVSDHLVGQAEDMNSGSPKPNNFFINSPHIWKAYKVSRGMKESLKKNLKKR